MENPYIVLHVQKYVIIIRMIQLKLNKKKLMSDRNGGDINQTHPKEPANNVSHVFNMISNEYDINTR